MSRRSLVSAASLVAGVLVLGAMAVLGLKLLTTPTEKDAPTASSSPTCAPEDRQVTRFRFRKEVTVSVFNAGAKKGKAQATLDRLEAAGFRAGEVGNAPAGTSVKGVRVVTNDSDDSSARLVAAFMGKGSQVTSSDEEFGPGVDVFLGKGGFGNFDPKAPRKVRLATPIVSCAR